MEMIVPIGAMEPYREEVSIRSPIFYSAGEMKLVPAKSSDALQRECYCWDLSPYISFISASDLCWESASVFQQTFLWVNSPND